MAEKGSQRVFLDYLKLIGITHVPIVPMGDDSNPPSDEKLERKGEELTLLVEKIGNCTRCPLHEGRTNLVFGTGDPGGRILFIGEGPGFNEDQKGEPFVGAAGKRLNRWITRIGCQREDVYIANVVKCRPPGNRTPLHGEAATCLPFLKEQIKIVSPPIIVTLGGPALNYLLSRKEKITRVRGTIFEYEGIPVLATYHPAYILRNPGREVEVMDDLEKITRFLSGL